MLSFLRSCLASRKEPEPKPVTVAKVRSVPHIGLKALAAVADYNDRLPAREPEPASLLKSFFGLFNGGHGYAIIPANDPYAPLVYPTVCDHKKHRGICYKCASDVIAFCKKAYYEQKYPDGATEEERQRHMGVVSRDMWDHYEDGNEDYRKVIHHRAMGWETKGLIPKGSAGGKQALKDIEPWTPMVSQRERRVTLMNTQAEPTATSSEVKEHNQEQIHRPRSATTPITNAETALSTSKLKTWEWLPGGKVEEESESDTGSEAEDGEIDWVMVQASKGVGTAAYLIRRDKRKPKSIRQIEKEQRAKLRAAKMARDVERASEAFKAYDAHNELYPTRPRAATSIKKVAFDLQVTEVSFDHPEDTT